MVNNTQGISKMASSALKRSRDCSADVAGSNQVKKTKMIIKKEPISPSREVDGGYSSRNSTPESISSSDLRDQNNLSPVSSKSSHRYYPSSVIFTASNSSGRSTPSGFDSVQIFCFNCKSYGHVRANCRSSWRKWWPVEYMRKYPSLRLKLRRANNLARNGDIRGFKSAHFNLERDIEEIEERRGRKPLQFGPRKTRGQSYSTPHPFLPDGNHNFQFHFEKKIDDLQLHVRQLQFRLDWVISRMNCY